MTVSKDFEVSKFIRVYPSAMDGFQYYCDKEGKDEKGLQSYVKSLVTYKTSPAMERGTKFHSAMENLALTGNWESEFSWEIEVEIPRPQHVEKRRVASRKSHYHDRTLVLSGIIDAIRGDTITDYKTTEKTIKLEKYIDSWQWRAYLTMVPECERFRYDIFRLQQRPARSGNWSVTEHAKVDLQRYDGMEDEVWSFAERFGCFLVELHDQKKLRIDGEGRLKPVI